MRADITLRLRPVTIEDADLLLTWRNDPITRMNSLNHELVDPRVHQDWLTGRLLDSDCAIFVIEHEDEPLGQIRLEQSGGRIDVSVGLAATARGRGVGTQSLRMAESEATRWPDAVLLTATVRVTNEASRRLFARAGFEEHSRESDVVRLAKRIRCPPARSDRPVPHHERTLPRRRHPMFKLGHREVSADNSPLLVAEIGANHGGSVSKAETMVRALAQQGAEAIKFQFYTADELVADHDRKVTWGAPGRTRTEPIGEMFDRLALDGPAIRDLMSLGSELGMVSFATPFSESGVDYLESIDVPGYKVAASDVGHLPLLQHISRTGKPVVLSLGKCTLGEAERAIDTLLTGGSQSVCLLHCTSEYPAPVDEMNLRAIPMLQAMYPGLTVGLSDHSLGFTVPVAAVALGATMVEKHVTISQEDDGPDDWFSFPIDRVGELRQALDDAQTSLGTARKHVTPGEEPERETATRSLVVSHDIGKGERITMEDIKIVRPGTGLAPAYLDAVLGLRVTRDLRANDLLSWDSFK